MNSKYFAIHPSQTVHVVKESADLPHTLSKDVDVRLFLGQVESFNQHVVDQADAAIQFFDQFDSRVRDTICREATNEHSVLGETYAQANLLETGHLLAPQEFAARLQVRAALITPSGGDDESDRLNVTYGFARRGVDRDFSAIVRLGSGLVFVAAAHKVASSGGVTWS